MGELSSIVNNDGVRDAVSTYDAFPYKMLDILGWDGG